MGFVYDDQHLLVEDKDRKIIIRGGGRPEEEQSTPLIYMGKYNIQFKYYWRLKIKKKLFPSGVFDVSILVSCVIPLELVVVELKTAIRTAENRVPSDDEIAQVLSDIQEGVLLLATFGGRYHEDAPDIKVAIEPGLMSWVTDRFGTHPAYHKDKINDALERNAVEVK